MAYVIVLIILKLGTDTNLGCNDCNILAESINFEGNNENFYGKDTSGNIEFSINIQYNYSITEETLPVNNNLYTKLNNYNNINNI